MDRCPPAWRHRLLLLFAACGLLALAYTATLVDLVHQWATSISFNHCFLIPFIALYLAWTKRTALIGAPPSVSFAGCWLALANGALWVLGALSGTAVLMHAALIGGVIALGWSLLGARAFRVLLFPFLYLYFAVPEGKFLVPYLQDWTAAVTVVMLRLTGIPVFIEGHYLTIPTGRFVIAEACSGINYLIATLAVGSMFMYLQFRAWWRRALFMVLALVVPLVANGLRAYGIVMIAHLSDYQYAIGVDHVIYGGIFFALVVYILFALGASFSDLDDAEAVAAAPQPAGPPVPTDRRRVAVVFVAALLALTVPRFMLGHLDAERTPASAIALPAVPGWRGPEPAPVPLGATFVGADQELTARYRNDAGAEVILCVAYYRGPGPGELLNQPSRIARGEGWEMLGRDLRPGPPGSTVETLVEMRVRDEVDSNDLAVRYWFDLQGRRTAERLPLKLAEMRARLAGRNDGGAFVTLVTSAADAERASTALDAFMAAGAIVVDKWRLPP